MEEDRGHQRQSPWGRLMPDSFKARSAFAGRLLLATATIAGVMVAFAVPYGWTAVLRFSLIFFGLAVIVFSGFLHHRAWVVIREEMERADEAIAGRELMLEQLGEVIREVVKKSLAEDGERQQRPKDLR